MSLFLYELHKNVVRAARDLKVATVVHALFMIRNHFLSCNTGCQSPCVSVWDYAYMYYIFMRVYMCMSVLCMWQALNTLRNTLDRSVHWYSLSAPYNVYGRKSSMYCFLVMSIRYGNVRFLVFDYKIVICPAVYVGILQKNVQ